MEKKKRGPELLAPAGTKESFYGSIKAGADAVYLAGKSFGARAYADNFETEDLIACIRYAHLYGRRVYLTVNTLMKSEEIRKLYEFLLPVYEAGLDGVIVQDLGGLLFMRDHFPGLELHASTQMTVTGPEGASLLKDFGVCRVVLARELSLSEIREMKEASGQEIECFIHGALCYCYSGQCLFSSVLGGRSGNRGRCAQPCRLPYSLDGTSGKEQYPLSLKDLNTVSVLSELTDAGIDSFKIEGRMKSPEYSAGVTSVYRAVIDRYLKNGDSKVTAEEQSILNSLYVRSEVCDGYYHRHNGAEMVTQRKPGYNKTPDELLEKIRTNYLEPAFTAYAPAYRVSLQASFVTGQEASLTAFVTMQDGTVLSGYATGDAVTEAQKRPVTEEELRKSLTKFGGTVFEPDTENIDIFMEGRIFYPVGRINDLRREVLRQLEREIIEFYGLPYDRIGMALPEDAKGKRAEQNTFRNAGQLSVMFASVRQLRALVNSSDPAPDRVYLTESMVLSSQEWKGLLAKLPEQTEKFLSLVPVRRKRDEKLFSRILEILDCGCFDGAEVCNLEDYARLQKTGYTGKIHLAASLYRWNSEAERFFAAEDGTVPIELDAHESLEFVRSSILPSEKIIYGRIPMMVSANCVQRTGKGCLHGNTVSWTHLTDRFGKRLPVAIDCIHCQNVIYNSVPTLLWKNLDRYASKCALRLNFTDETDRETEVIWNYYRELRSDHFTHPMTPPLRDYTTGHEMRPAE